MRCNTLIMVEEVLRCGRIITIDSDGRSAEYTWRPLFNAAVWLTPTTRVSCSNAAKMRNQLKF